MEKKVKLALLNKTFKEIKKSKGEEIFREYGEVKRVKNSSPNINRVLGGGVPLGRIIEVFGKESSGKSLIATEIASDYQKNMDAFVLWIDMERTFDYKFAEKLGLNTSEEIFRVLEPDTGEDAFEVADALVDTGAVGLVVFDSVASMLPKAELEGDYSDQTIGIKARMLSKSLPKLLSKLADTQTTAIFVNQVRANINTFSSYGENLVGTGGKSLPFYSSIRLKVAKKEYINNKQGEPIGLVTKIKTMKNKTAPVGRSADLVIYFDNGIDKFDEYIDMAIRYEIIDKAGSWFSIPGLEDRVQGKHKVAEYYRENEEKFNNLKEEVLNFENKVDNVIEAKKEDLKELQDQIIE